MLWEAVPLYLHCNYHYLFRVADFRSSCQDGPLVLGMELSSHQPLGAGWMLHKIGLCWEEKQGT